MDIEEKRVYADRTGRREAYVATAAGVATVAVSGAHVGEFGLASRDPARDVAAGGGLLAVATGDDVHLGTGFEASAFGPAVAVGFAGGTPLAAGPDGRVARYDDGWTDLGRVPEVRALDGDLVAAAGGIYRAEGTHVGLDDARDVATAGGPFAATGNGLYRLGNGWLDETVPGERGACAFAVVAGDGERVHAASGDELYRLEAGEWTACDLPVAERVADVAHAGDCTYAVTGDGTVLAHDPGEPGWRAQTLGLPEVRAIAVP